MTNFKKAQEIYAHLFPEDSGGNVPSFEELAAYVSHNRQFSCRLKTGEKKLKIDVQAVWRHDNHRKERTDMEENFNIPLFLFILALAAAGLYGLWRVFGKKDRDAEKHYSAPPQTENSTPPSAAAPERKREVPGKKQLLLVIAIEKLDALFPDCSAGTTVSIQNNGGDLFKKHPWLLADQTEEQAEEIKKKVSQAKPARGGYAILAVLLSADAMIDFQKGRSNSVQRSAFEKLNGKDMSVLGFWEKVPEDSAFYDIG